MKLQHHCKMWNLFFSVLLICFFSLFINLNISESYYFWLKSADNTPENIEAIENTYNVNLPVVSFIFDPRDENDVLNSIDRIVGNYEQTEYIILLFLQICTLQTM